MDARAVREDRFMARRVLVGSGPMPTFSNEADKFMRIRSSLCIQDGWSRDEHPAGKTELRRVGGDGVRTESHFTRPLSLS